MAFNVYDKVKGIYDAKGAWTAADKAGDKKKAQSIANDAKKLYDDLIANGYGDVADKLSKSTYDQAKVTHDFYAKTGRTKASDYLTSLGKAYGLTDKDIAGLTSYDATTGEMSFGGKNIGKPDAMVDGDSYWTDTGVLKNAFDDYVSISGTARSGESFVSQENENLMKKYEEQMNYLKDTNPFETPEGKAILAKYELKGFNERDGEFASGGASNGGNIDSFAAANARRQQAALTAQGQDAVLASHQQKLDHAMALLEGMGVHIDRVYNQNETSLNNQLARDVQTAEVTGIVPTSMLYQSPLYSQFFNSDGTLKDENIDYKAELEKARANGDTELEKVLKAARGVKIFGNYAKYAAHADGDYTLPGATKTETARQYDENIAQKDRAIQAEQKMNTENNASAEKIEGIKAQNNLDVQKLKNGDTLDEEENFDEKVEIDYETAIEWLKENGASAEARSRLMTPEEYYKRGNVLPYGDYVMNFLATNQ